MVAPARQRKVLANGKDSWYFVPAIAVPGTPVVTEVNSASGINASCALLASFEGVTGSTGKVTPERFLCETEQYEANDNTTFTMSDIVGGFDPQAAIAHADKKIFEFFRNGFTGYAVRRQGITAATDTGVVSGQFVDVVPVEVAPAIPGKSNTDASGIYTFSAAVAVTGKPEFNVAVAA